MADINARTRLLVGTTANWAAADLVLGDGEVVLERAGTATKMKVGDGAKKFSQLGYLQMMPVIPPEYMDQAESDARYLMLTDISTAQAANKVPRLGANGMLASAMIPLPPAVDVTTGAADAGKLVKLASTGKIDPSMITVTTGTYKGLVDATGPKPVVTYIAGDYYINTATGAAHASWGLPANTQVAPQQQLVYNGTAWGVVGASAGSLIRLPDGTVGAPGLAFVNDAATGLWRPGANAMAFSVNGIQRATLTDLQFNVRDGGVYGGSGANASRDAIVIESNGATGLSFLTPNTQSAAIVFGDNDASSVGYLTYSHTVDQLAVGVASGTRVIFDAAYLRCDVPVMAADGTAAAPSYAFTSQPTWGMFRVPAVGMGWAMNGAELARLAVAGLTFSAGGTCVMHNDTASYLAITAAPNANDGNARLVLYDALHATTPKLAVLCGRGIVFADATQATQEKGRFTASTSQPEFLVGRTTALYAATGRAAIEIDGPSAGALLGLHYGGGRCGYLYAFSATEFRLSTGLASVAMTFCLNGVEVARVDTDSTFQYKAQEVGWRDIPVSTSALSRGGCYSVAANVAFGGSQQPGYCFGVYNNSAGAIQLIQNAGLTMRLAGTTTTGTRILAARGYASVLYVAASECVVTGNVT